MNLSEKANMSERSGAGYSACVSLPDGAVMRRASMSLRHLRPSRWLQLPAELLKDAEIAKALEAKGAKQEGGALLVPDPSSYEEIGEETTLNQITNAGRDFIHTQSYGTSPAGNGLNWIALTNTNVTPAAGDTALSGEIATNGLARAQGVVSHTGGTNTTTIANTFTCAAAPQACQAAALFTAASVGTMNHELNFTQRSLQIGDQIAVTYTITIG